MHATTTHDTRTTRDMLAMFVLGIVLGAFVMFACVYNDDNDARVPDQVARVACAFVAYEDASIAFNDNDDARIACVREVTR